MICPWCESNILDRTTDKTHDFVCSGCKRIFSSQDQIIDTIVCHDHNWCSRLGKPCPECSKIKYPSCLVDDISTEPISEERTKEIQETISNMNSQSESFLFCEICQSKYCSNKEHDKTMKTPKAATDKVGTGLTLIPLYSLLALGKIFIEGLRYGKDNWKKGVNDKEYQEERLEHALLHFIKYKEGDRSEAHLAKVAWFCFTQLELERLEKETNND